MKKPLALSMGLLILLLGCHNSTDTPPKVHTPQNNSAKILRTQLDQHLRQQIQQHQLSGIPISPARLPHIDSPKAQLGKQLFFSKGLSGDLDTACASCHHPLLGGGDRLSLSIGVGAKQADILGQPRSLSASHQLGVPRNAPTTFNIGFWQHNLFYDGRIEQRKLGITTPDVPYPQVDPKAGENLVQAQARFPITSVHEMRGQYFAVNEPPQACRKLLAERLGGYNRGLPNAETHYWLQAFRKAFNSPERSAAELITEQNISYALGEYQRSQVFTNTPWKHYIQGDSNALSKQAKRGALLFFRNTVAGGYNCVQCHSGDFFSDEKFHNTLIPPIGPGKNADNPHNQQDYGRWYVTGKAADKFRFRTPSLLNVTETGPWGHNGAYVELTDMVKHMLNPFQAALAYDSKQLQQSGVPTQMLQANLREMLNHNTDLSGQSYKDQDVQDLVAFLESLTDPCVKNIQCLTPWLPDPIEQSPMGLQLKAKFTP